MTKAEVIAAIAAAKKAGNAEEVAALEAQLASIVAATDVPTTTTPIGEVVYPERTRERGEMAQIRNIDVQKFTSSNGKPKVARIILRNPVSIVGYDKKVGVVYLSKAQADKLCAAARVRTIQDLADFVAFGDGVASVDLDVLVDSDGNEQILPASIELHSSVKKDLRAISMRNYERTMSSVTVDAFADSDSPVAP